MGAKKFFHTHRSIMCGLKKIALRVFSESWKVFAKRRRWRRWRRRRQRKRTKNNKSPGYPGWLNNRDSKGYKRKATWWVGVVGFSNVATFNHVGGSLNLFMATTADVRIISSFSVWCYVLHVEHTLWWVSSQIVASMSESSHLFSQ